MKEKQNLAQFMRRFTGPKVNRTAQRILAARRAQRAQDGKFTKDAGTERNQAGS